MTAEISILNTRCVALAADSAITINSKKGYSKIYNYANKIFSLSPDHAIGIMIFDNSQFLGLDWEIIISGFQKHISGQKISKLYDLEEKFIDYIISQKDFFISEETLVYDLINFLLKDIFKENEKLTTLDNKEFNQLLYHILKHNFLASIPKEDMEDFKQFYDSISDDLFLHVTNYISYGIDEYKVYKKIKEPLMKLIAAKIFLKNLPNKSGIVITGYGEEEMYPSLIELHINSYLFKNIIYSRKNTVNIHPEEMSACIIPFAQKEMVYTFMEGIDPYLHKILIDSVRPTLEVLTDVIQEKTKTNIDFSGQVEFLVNELENVIIEIREAKFVNPILSTVEFLPKESLSEMAETLINLTSFKRKISTDLETVGGPIDVAIISKSNGFEWVNKKE